MLDEAGRKMSRKEMVVVMVNTALDGDKAVGVLDEGAGR